MTVGVVEPYIRLGEDGLADLPATIAGLQVASAAIRKLAAAYTAAPMPAQLPLVPA